MDRLEIERTNADELVRRMAQAFEASQAPLLERLAELERQVAATRRWLTPSQVADVYFEGRTKSARVRDYCNGRQLPKGVDRPLPCRRIGNSVLIATDELERWLDEAG